ncbi:hypothetical protein M432DRAFT_102813 [Thermoascus aurantiacus ATCC 26904]
MNTFPLLSGFFSSTLVFLPTTSASTVKNTAAVGFSVSSKALSFVFFPAHYICSLLPRLHDFPSFSFFLQVKLARLAVQDLNTTALSSVVTNPSLLQGS